MELFLTPMTRGFFSISWNSGIVNAARYRTRTIPAAGALLKDEDAEEKQIVMEL